MVRGRQLDPAVRARIFELRAIGCGAKKIHKRMPDVPFNTIKTTLRRSKTAAAAANAAAGNTTARLHPGSDDSPSPSPALDPHRELDVSAALAGHPLASTPAGPNPLASVTPSNRGLPGALPPQQQVPNALGQQKHQHHQPQQQQHPHHQPPGAGNPGAQLPRPNIAPTLPGDPQTRRPRDLINEIDILPGGGGSGGPNGASAPTLDLDRLKAEYRAMPDAQRIAAENELDLRKAALVSAKWEAQRELDAARRQAQIDQLQALQQEGLDPETFYARFRQLVQPPG